MRDTVQTVDVYNKAFRSTLPPYGKTKYIKAHTIYNDTPLKSYLNGTLVAYTPVNVLAHCRTDEFHWKHYTCTIITALIKGTETRLRDVRQFIQCNGTCIEFSEEDEFSAIPRGLRRFFSPEDGQLGGRLKELSKEYPWLEVLTTRRCFFWIRTFLMERLVRHLCVKAFPNFPVYRHNRFSEEVKIVGFGTLTMDVRIDAQPQLGDWRDITISFDPIWYKLWNRPRVINTIHVDLIEHETLNDQGFFDDAFIWETAHELMATIHNIGSGILLQWERENNASSQTNNGSAS